MDFRCVSFSIDEEHFGIHLDDVVHIIRCERVLPVPGAPAVVEGVLNLRGEVVPVINLRHLFGLPAPAAGRRQRVIIIRREERIFGLLVDGVSEIKVNEADYHPGKGRSGLNSEAVLGVVNTGEKTLTLLDIFKLLAGLPQAASARPGKRG